MNKKNRFTWIFLMNDSSEYDVLLVLAKLISALCCKFEPLSGSRSDSILRRDVIDSDSLEEVDDVLWHFVGDEN